MSLAYALDEYQFITFHQVQNRAAPPPVIMQQVETVMRPGVSGTGLILHGLQGQPFQMRSFVDAAGITAAMDLQARYAELVGAGKLRLIWAGVNYRVAYNTDFFVLAVDPGQARRVSAWRGGLTSGGAVVEALWTLQACLK